MANRQQGRITKWQDDKGFGFITEDNNKENVFFHGNNADQPLKKGKIS